jgi:hypothetical protein
MANLTVVVALAEIIIGTIASQSVQVGNVKGIW